MAHFAEIDKNNTVTRVLVVDNKELLVDGKEVEEKGIEFLQTIFGKNTIWVQTSYNGKFRNKFAGIGDEYNTELNAFISPKPYPSWVLDKENITYIAPKPQPSETSVWDEEKQEWITN